MWVCSLVVACSRVGGSGVVVGVLAGGGVGLVGGFRGVAGGRAGCDPVHPEWI